MSVKIVGILNVTPDSFSDGGLVGNLEAIIDTTLQLIEDGTDVIDIGAESTRPGAIALSYSEEWRRLEQCLPKICEIAKKAGVLTSIDTRHPQTASKAISAGIDWVNDVSGAGNKEMLKVLAPWHGKVVIMHNLGVPVDKNVTIPANKDAVEEVYNWLTARIKLLEDNGITKNRIIIDPGVGFGKTAQQSWEIINRIAEFKGLGAEIFVGHSRKSFLNIKGDNADKDKATLEVSKQLAQGGVHYLRVHNVWLHKVAMSS